MFTIETNEDFTPLGKRGAKIVQTSRGGSQLRWYVGGRTFRYLAPSSENIAITREWLVSVSTLPQPWEAFT